MKKITKRFSRKMGAYEIVEGIFSKRALPISLIIELRFCWTMFEFISSVSRLISWFMFSLLRKVIN